MHQISFSDEAYTCKKKTTREERFLCEMNEVLPWDDLLQPILRYYPKPGRGRRPIPAETMLRIYFMQQWYGLSDPAMEDRLYDVASMRRFAGVALDAIPDETTICKFRHFLERHRLTEILFECTGQYLSERGLILREGTIVDATLLAAPTSTKNRDQARDPQMGFTKKGTTWHFGLKAHVGSDRQGRVHPVVVTSASVHDSQMIDECLHGDEEVIYGDKAYVDAAFVKYPSPPTPNCSLAWQRDGESFCLDDTDQADYIDRITPLTIRGKNSDTYRVIGSR